MTALSATLAAPDPAAARSYRVEYWRDHRRDSRLHWRLYTYGPGAWCVGSGHSGSFASETEAHEYGRGWVATGVPACEQRRVA
jgi:hypothetical protein